MGVSARKRKPKLTLKSLGLVERPGFILDDMFANSRTCFRVVDTTNILGYYFVGDGHRSPVRIAPIYRAIIYARPSGALTSMYESHVIGGYLNSLTTSIDDLEDWVANYAAHAALLSLNAVKRSNDIRRANLKAKRTKR